ncbi:MAG: UbiA family prenyltransferase [Candidatus Latescibacteria bacterium]|nr:UbiA family prenyltransferase [Candidatus Latescibacterota bacterium]
MTFFRRVVTYGRMIKFSHSLFALPFAMTAVVFASRERPVTFRQVVWIVVAMVGTRSAAMGFNRLVDRTIDAANPRTWNRELPRGILTSRSASVFVAVSSALLILAASQLNRLCLLLSPVALGIVFFYSYTKRFTWTSHLFLGLALGIAPTGAWIAVMGGFGLPPFLLGFAVLTWVAGFDVIYACQDYHFDRRYGLSSIPQTIGVGKALLAARFFHVVTFVSLIGLKFVLGLGSVYTIGLIVVAGILIYEHRLVRAGDLSKLNVAFFNMNGILSLLYFAFALGDILL